MIAAVAADDRTDGEERNQSAGNGSVVVGMEPENKAGRGEGEALNLELESP